MPSAPPQILRREAADGAAADHQDVVDGRLAPRDAAEDTDAQEHGQRPEEDEEVRDARQRRPDRGKQVEQGEHGDHREHHDGDHGGLVHESARVGEGSVVARRPR